MLYFLDIKFLLCFEAMWIEDKIKSIDSGLGRSILVRESKSIPRENIHVTVPSMMAVVQCNQSATRWLSSHLPKPGNGAISV
jgi:hypothetical protein